MASDARPERAGRSVFRCERCGDAIGVYELLVYRDQDGSTVRTSLLRLPEHLRTHPGETRFFHATCHLC